MPRTALTPIYVVGPYPAGGTVAALALDLAFTAADVANGNQWASAGDEILLVWNTDVSQHHFTLTSAPDARGRSDDITNYAVAAGVISAFKVSAMDGWRQSDGNVYVSGDNAAVKFAVLKRS